MKRLAAFTLMELMITLLISAVIIGISFGVLSIFNTQFGRYRKRTAEIRTFRLLSGAFQRDFDRADRINDTLDVNHLVLAYPDTLIYYTFLHNDCIRMISTIDNSVLASDTFAIGTERIDNTYLNDSLPIISGVSIKTIVNGDRILLSAGKIYSAQQIMGAIDYIGSASR